MIEDKLEHDERVRLECVAQAVARNAMNNKQPDQIVSEAKTYEQYVMGVTK